MQLSRTDAPAVHPLRIQRKGTSIIFSIFCLSCNSGFHDFRAEAYLQYSAQLRVVAFL